MQYSRRRYIALAGFGVTAALAGCIGGDGGDGEDCSGDGDDEPADGTDGTDDGQDGGGDGSSETDNGGGTDGDGHSSPSPPPADADPKDYLPDPLDGWEREQPLQVIVDSIDAEAGYGARYYDPDGGEYWIELIRWSSESAAVSGWEEYGSFWKFYVTHGTFSYAANGPEKDALRRLLANSPTLTDSYIRENNLADGTE